MLELQEKNDLPRSIAFVISTGQSIALADEAARFFNEVEFDPPDEGEVRGLHPAGPASPVLIDPEATGDIAIGYDMPTELVRAAVPYEEQQRSLAA